MIDIEGCVEIASKWQDGQRGEEQKVDLVVGELKKYNVGCKISVVSFIML